MNSKRPGGNPGDGFSLIGLDSAIYGDVENDDALQDELFALIGYPEPNSQTLTSQQAPTAPVQRPVRRTEGTVQIESPSRGAPSLDTLDFDFIKSLGNLEEAEANLDERDDPGEFSADLDNELDLILGNNAQLQVDGSGASAVARSRTPSPGRAANAGGGEGASQRTLLEDRLQMYRLASKKASDSGDGNKARRCNRGIKTLQNQLRIVGKGGAVPVAEIPPPIGMGSSATPRTDGAANAESVDSSPVGPSLKPVTGDLDETLISAGQSASTRDIPSEPLSTPTSEMTAPMVPPRARKRVSLSPHMPDSAHTQDEKPPAEKTVDRHGISDEPPQSKTINIPVPDQTTPVSPPQQTSPTTDRSASELFHAPPTPKTLLGALQQRMEKYRETADKAKAEGNASKARRHLRIYKQYAAAIADHKAGKRVDTSYLPIPPGFGPIPGENISTPEAGSSNPTANLSTGTPKGNSPAAGQQARSAGSAPRQPSPSRHGAAATNRGTPTAAASGARSPYQQQLEFLVQRQGQFKDAALYSKQMGDIEQAKNYLRQMKGFDAMIQAASNGVRVDIRKVPSLPKQAVAGLIRPVTHKRTAEPDIAPSGRSFVGSITQQSREEIFATLEKDLISQYQKCLVNAEHFTRLGDISNAVRYDELGAKTARDLMSLRNAWKHGSPTPRFHYEQRKLPSLQTCADLSENDVEVQVLRGIQIRSPGSDYEPKDMAVFVRVVFPFPLEDPPEDRSPVVKGTNSPTFKFSTKFSINRKSRAFQRAIQHKSIKFEVFQKGHIFRSDKLLGAIEVKLAALESDCMVHHSVDLTEGRRPCGGKLEVRVRIRDPLAASGKMAVTEEKWAVIDRFLR